MKLNLALVGLIILTQACNPLKTMTPSTNGKAQKNRKTFALAYTVTININAKPDAVWAVLTKGEDYTKWNSTITSFEGTIAKGEKIKLKTTLDEKRTFKLKVSEMIMNQKMVWSSGAAPMFKGVRTYTLTEKPDGTTDYTMTEVLKGAMLPMIAGSLPDFRESFEQFAADLKTEVEK